MNKINFLFYSKNIYNHNLLSTIFSYFFFLSHLADGLLSSTKHPNSNYSFDPFIVYNINCFADIYRSISLKLSTSGDIKILTYFRSWVN